MGSRRRPQYSAWSTGSRCSRCLIANRIGWCRFGDEGIDLVISDRRYVIDAELHFPLSTVGVYLFANTIVNLDDIDTVLS